MLSRKPGVRKELVEQAAFEEAERRRAEKRASALFDSLVGSSPVAIEIFDTNGTPLFSNKAAERLLGKVPPPGFCLFEERGLKRAGLLEPQLKRVLAGTRVETPPTWYDPTEIGLAGVPGRKICFRATVLPLFDSEGVVKRIAVVYEDITELVRLEKNLEELRIRQQTEAARLAPDVVTDTRNLDYSRRKIEQALHESEERRRALVETAKNGIAVCELDDAGHFLSISQSIETIWGISAAAILEDASLFFAQIHPEDIKGLQDTELAIRRQLAIPDRYRFRVIHRETGKVSHIDTQTAVFTIAGRKLHYRIFCDVTQLVTLEQSLSEKNVLLEALLASDQESVVLLDRNLVVMRWSPGAERQTGIPAVQAVGLLITELFPEFSSAGFTGVLHASLSTLSCRQHEAFCPHIDKEKAGWYHLTSYPWGSGLLVFLRNITAFKTAQLKLEQMQTVSTSLLSTQVDALAVLDSDLTIISWNAAIARETSIPTEQAEGKSLLDVLPGIRDAGFLQAIQQTMRDRTPRKHEAFCTDVRQQVAGWYELTFYPWTDGLLIFLRNTTEEKNVRLNLAQRQADMQALCNSEIDGVILLDENLTVVSWNRAAERETRITSTEATGRSITDLYPAFAETGFLPVIQKCITQRTSSRYEAFYDDGRDRYAGWFSLSAHPWNRGALILIKNISHWKKAEQAWQQTEAQLKALLNLPGLAIATKDGNLRYTFANKEARRMLSGTKVAPLLGMSDHELLKTAVADLLSSYDRQALLESRAVSLEIALPDAVTPGSRWYHIIKVPFQAGEPTKSAVSHTDGPPRLSASPVFGTITVGIDITRQVSALQELTRRKEFLESVVRQYLGLMEQIKSELKNWERPL